MKCRQDAVHRVSWKCTPLIAGRLRLRRSPVDGLAAKTYREIVVRPYRKTSGRVSEMLSPGMLLRTATQQGEPHMSCKYTKDELMERKLGVQAGRLTIMKALLRMGVCEEDLVIAERLMKLEW